VRDCRCVGDLTTSVGAGNTPLHEAAKKNLLGAVKALMAGGADPEIKNNEGQTAADLASKSLIKKQLVRN
jgi:ankyrin repeat protein